MQSLLQWGLGFAAAVAFLPEIINSATSPRWAILAVMIPMVGLVSTLPSRLPWKWIAVFGLPIVASALSSPPTLERVLPLATMGMAFILGASLPSLRIVWHGLAVGVVASCLLGVAQFMGFEGIPQALGPAGLFMNKNVLAESALIAAIIGASLGSIWILGLSFFGLAFTLSKAALGIGLAVLVIWLFKDERGLLKWVAVLLLSALAALAMWPEWASLAARKEIWTEALRGLTVWGSGIGTFKSAYPEFEYVHLEPLQLAFEMGIFSIPILAAVLYLLRDYRGKLEDTILLAVCGLSLFSFPTHMPITAFAMALAMGHLAWRRGDDVLQSDLGGNWPREAPRWVTADSRRAVQATRRAPKKVSVLEDSNSNQTRTSGDNVKS